MHDPVTGLRLQTAGPAETQDLAAALADVLVDGDLLVLTGDLGAGKTCFAQGLGRGLGIEDRITSPTFTLANTYRGRLTLHHLDVYRLNSVAETLDLGLAELLEDGVTVIEWGDRITEVLPADHLLVALRFPDFDPAVYDPNGAEEFDSRVDEREIDIRFGPASSPRWSARGLDGVLARWAVPT